MRVQTVLTFFDGSREGEEQLQSAIDAALWFDAHLSVASVSYAPEFRHAAQYTPDRAVLRMHAANDALDRSREVFARLKAQGVHGVAFPFVTTRANFERQFSCLSRYSDVTVQSRSSRPIAEESLPFVSQERVA